MQIQINIDHNIEGHQPIAVPYQASTVEQAES